MIDDDLLSFPQNSHKGIFSGASGLLRICIILVSLMVFAGCATTATQTPSSFKPRSLNDIKFRDRSQSKYDDEVRVTVAVPTADENKALFSANLYLREIQPVWVKVENHSDRTYYLLSIPFDPNYFSPLETAYSVHGGLNQSARREMEKYYRRMNFRNPILPNTAVSGFIFTNLDEGEKIVQVNLLAVERVKVFTFFLQIPGMRVDYKMVDFDSLYPKEEIVELSEDRLWATLEKFPCCTTNEEGTGFGDPINLVIIADFQNIAAAFARRGWLPAEETYSTAVLKTIKSFLFGSRYRYSPVSPLYFFGRHQDFARQKPRHDIHERNHLRLWYSPFRYLGKPVFVGQISRDIGVRFTTKTWPPVTHKIDPDIDEARHALVEDLIFSQMLAKVGWVKGVGPARPSKPRANLTGDPYFTDGYRTVLILEQGPIALNQIKEVGPEAPRILHLDSESGD
jgi:hypothetical protein